MNDGLINRIKRKALGNQLVIAIGSSLSKESYSVIGLGKEIQEAFKINFPIQHQLEYFYKWNELIDVTEKSVSREALYKFIREKLTNITLSKLHKKIALIPISNFIDVSLDRSLTKAICESGRKPIIHDFFTQKIGSWEQSNPQAPNIFYSFCGLERYSPWFGLHDQLCYHPQNRIQLENMMEMVSEKDLLLINFSSYEAESILHLNYLVGTSHKIINTNDINNDPQYWNRRGVCILNMEPEKLIDYLLPSHGIQYSFWDSFVPRRKLIDVTRHKEYDGFISYFSGDKAFAKRLHQDLMLRGLHIWRDDNEINIGDSFTDKIQEGLKNSYTFIIILSPEALSRPWVKEELRAAYALRLAEEFKILPVLYKDCEIPLLLSDYKYADFREEKRYEEQIQLLEKSINNAVKKSRKKK